MKTVLVCGGRDYMDRHAVFEALDAFHAEHGIGKVLHGNAPGADRLADEWARLRGITAQPFPADWRRWGNNDGFLRNRKMLEEGKPDLIIAFPGGRGTAHMIRIAGETGVATLFG